MCGIAGFTGEYQIEKANTRIRSMAESISHRGPDADGFFVRPGIALGHRRLSIIDLSTSANQPMSDPSGRYQIIYNGELYNFKEVKARLQHYTFRTESDTEAVLAAFIEWGPACLNFFNGMFAFAIWDEASESLFVARDRLGIKPLYYTINGDHFVFASEIRALLTSSYVDGELEATALHEYLAYYSVNAPRTLLKDIFMLLPGHFAQVKEGEVEIKQYWSMWNHTERKNAENYQQCCQQVLNQCRRAVSSRLMSDVPFGAFLSGGIDSSAIVALMAESSEQPVHTFSVIFGEKEYDESQWSTLVAQKYNTLHHPIPLSPNDFLEALPAALDAMDHPSGDAVNTYVVSQATRKEGFTVALSGLGGDELFAGYPVFKRYERLRKMNYLYQIPQAVRSVIGKSITGIYRNHKSARLQTLIEVENNDFPHLYPVFREVFSPTEIEQLTGRRPCLPHESLDQILPGQALARIEQMPLFSQISVGELSTYTVNVLLRDTDQMSMAHSLEVRVPFLDHELVSMILGISDEWKNPVYPKKLLVDSLGNLLPGEVVHRKKMGFSFPWEHWLRNELKTLCRARMDSLAKRELFDGGVVRQIYRGFENGNKRISWIKVWLMVVLEEWLSKNNIHA